MIEAVGHEYWATYFTTIDRVLAPGGRVGIQAITMPHDRMLATRRTYTWINKYIFPGGFLPSVEASTRSPAPGRPARDQPAVLRSPLRRDAAPVGRGVPVGADEVRDLGFDPTFQRMWHFYLEYSRAGFTSGYLDVQQLTLSRRVARDRAPAPSPVSRCWSRRPR